MVAPRISVDLISSLSWPVVARFFGRLQQKREVCSRHPRHSGMQGRMVMNPELLGKRDAGCAPAVGSTRTLYVIAPSVGESGAPLARRAVSWKVSHVAVHDWSPNISLAQVECQRPKRPALAGASWRIIGRSSVSPVIVDRVPLAHRRISAWSDGKF
jgi:hypothetical protein